MEFIHLILSCMIWTLGGQGSPILQDNLSQQGFNRIKRRHQAQADPWTLNRGVCPPALCGPDAGAIVDRHDYQSSRARPRASALVTSKDAVASEPARGFPFFEGDIVLDKEMSERLSLAKRPKRSIVRPVTRLWQYGIIPYVVDSMLPRRTKALIDKAIRHIENHTCITFQPRNESRDEDYIFFIHQPGCWSFVGKRGGAQYVSLGRGCEYFGTVVHETIHAIGFWHEQSRLDRDLYVQLLTENVAPSSRDQFGIRRTTESTSRGFAYDYESIMHYGTHYFSRNGKPTLKVVGIGKELKMKVGQRKRLSDIDIAQLRDMYHCNEKAAELSDCKQGWKRFGRSCYLFVTDPLKNYGGAAQACLKEGAYLVHIESQDEDDFLKRYLITNFPNHTEWRTGGRRSSGQWVWRRSGTQGRRIEKEMNYTDWSPQHPGSFSSLTLNLFRGTPHRFVWRGAWAGSAKDLPKYAHSYICEARTEVRCIQSRRNGRNYRGKLNYTSSSVTCQRWSAQYPHKHKYLRGKRRDVDITQSGLGDHNYCRNPEGQKKRPWCFTTKSGKKWEYCDVHICKKKQTNSKAQLSNSRA